MTANEYLTWILSKYKARDLGSHSLKLALLKVALKEWAGTCFLNTLDSGSRAKWTAIAFASDVDYMISLKSDCNNNNWGIKSIYESLFKTLDGKYSNVRRQNVSVRITFDWLEVDITPARKHPDNSNDHWIYSSKRDTIQQTNIQIHINDVSKSQRLNEIKLLKIWRELHGLDFPSIYLEYLVIKNILSYSSTSSDKLSDNFWFIITSLAKDTGNPLYSRIEDPANSRNILSDLLSDPEKKKIIATAKMCVASNSWNKTVW